MRSTAATVARRLERRGMFAHPLAREIGAVLVVKVVLLLAGFLLFFGPQTRLHLTPDGILQHLAAPGAGGDITPGGSND